MKVNIYTESLKAGYYFFSEVEGFQAHLTNYHSQLQMNG